jgi:amino acid transporter
VLLVAYGFVRLTQHFNHAGSVYGFVGLTLGPRAGVLAGWTLVGTYILFAVVTGTAAGIFTTDFLDAIGVWNDPPQWGPFVVAPILLACGWVIATPPNRPVTRALLSFEGITVLLILAIAVVVLVKVIVGDAPHGQTFTLKPFVPPPDVNTGDLFKGAVFGFLSFAGFEAAATLGEETRDPRRAIPRAILGTAIVAGVYFVFVTAIEVMGFGAGPAGVAALQSSGSLLGDLGSSYIGDWMGDLVTLGTAISALRVRWPRASAPAGSCSPSAATAWGRARSDASHGARPSRWPRSPSSPSRSWPCCSVCGSSPPTSRSTCSPGAGRSAR